MIPMAASPASDRRHFQTWKRLRALAQEVAAVCAGYKAASLLEDAVDEAEWERCSDAQEMLHFARQRYGERKMRLLACACARHLWAGLAADGYRRAVEAAERYADGLADRSELGAADEEIWLAGWSSVRGDADANAAARAAIEPFSGNAAGAAILRVGDAATAIVRDILGNPFRGAIEPDPAIGDPRVVALARQVYDERRFEVLPRLAALLSELGCQDSALLDHLRSAGPHFRGCWALDAILGKDQGKDLVTEAQWREETHPFHMLVWWRYFRGEPSPRKQRLLACAACRLSWHLFHEEVLRRTVETAEALADGRAAEADLVRLRDQARALGLARGQLLSETSGRDAAWEARRASWCAGHAAADAAEPEEPLFESAMHYMARDGGSGRDTEDAGQAALIREILGNLLRPARFEPAWRTPDVLTLARGIDEEQAFDRMPILADALQDAGCDDPDILGHCREQGAHARGCWLIDRVLEKE